MIHYIDSVVSAHLPVIFSLLYAVLSVLFTLEVC